MYVNETYLPPGEAELAGLIARAASQKLPLEIRGNGSKHFIGRPMQVATRLSTSELRGITLYEPAELVISARSGTPLAEIEALGRKNGQEIPRSSRSTWSSFSPFETRGPATIGGVISANSSGRGAFCAAARAIISRHRAVNGLGEIIKSGGRVMKNVTGYDLGRGIAGSWGTLAVLTEITLKVLPKAEEMRTLIFLNLPDEGAVTAMCRAVGSAFEISGTVHLEMPFVERLSDPDIAKLGRSVTALRVENFSASLDYRVARLHEELRGGAIYELDDNAPALLARLRGLSFLSGSDWPLGGSPRRPTKVQRSLRHCAAARMPGRFDVVGRPDLARSLPREEDGAVWRRVIAEFQPTRC